MGNWRTVHIVGSIDPAEVEPLRRHLLFDHNDPSFDWNTFGPLTISRSMAGLCDWVSAKVDASGNLAERDYSPEDVADHLRNILTVAPSAELKVHCGGDWESETCIATVTAASGEVAVGDPEVATVSAVDQTTAMARMIGFLAR